MTTRLEGLEKILLGQRSWENPCPTSIPRPDVEKLEILGKIRREFCEMLSLRMNSEMFRVMFKIVVQLHFTLSEGFLINYSSNDVPFILKLNHYYNTIRVFYIVPHF